MSLAPVDRIDQAIDSGLAYVPGDPVLVHVVRRGHRYLVTDDGIVGEAGENRFHVMPIACLDIFLKDRRQIEIHDDFRVTHV